MLSRVEFNTFFFKKVSLINKVRKTKKELRKWQNSAPEGLFVIEKQEKDVSHRITHEKQQIPHWQDWVDFLSS